MRNLNVPLEHPRTDALQTGVDAPLFILMDEKQRQEKQKCWKEIVGGSLTTDERMMQSI
jgi:hypothetical protein